MKPRHFIRKLRHEDLVRAIGEAEQKTSGEIRVFISDKAVEAPVSVAQAHFLRMGMQKTRHRNAVLIFVAPRSRKFAVIGDLGVHQRCGDGFWRELADEMTQHFKESDFNRGILHGVAKAGELLARHFPRQPDDANELPDEVEED